MTERAPATGRPVSVFGRSVSGRYTWHADNMRVHRAALGRLAGRSATFSAMVARPLSVRSARQEQAAAATRTGYLPVATPAAPYLGAWWQRQAADAAATAEAAATADADRARRTPSVARRSPPGGGGAAVPSAAPEPPPIGLPRVSSRGMRTRAGEATAPGSASERLKSPKIYVRHPDEVAGVGPMLTPREARQAAGPRPSRRADGDPDRPAGGPPAPARRSRASRSSSVHGGAGRVTVGAVARPGPAARAAAGRATARRMAAEVVADRRVALPAARLEPSGPVATLRPGLAAGSAGSGAVARAALAARADQAAPVADEGATGAATGVGLLPIAETRAADTTTGDGGPAGPEAPDHPTAQRSVDDASPAAAGAADRTGPGHRDVASQGPAVRRSGTAGSAPVAATWSADEAAAAVRPGRAPSALRRAASAGLTALRRRPARRGPVTGPGPMPAPPAGARGLTGAAGGEPAPPSSGQRTPGSDQASPTATGRQATGATSGAAVATPRSGAAVATPPSDATGSPVGTPTMAATPPPTSGPEALQRSADIPGPSAAGAGGEAAATSPGGSAADAPGAPAAGASAGSGGFANLATTDAGQPASAASVASRLAASTADLIAARSVAAHGFTGHLAGVAVAPPAGAGRPVGDAGRPVGDADTPRPAGDGPASAAGSPATPSAAVAAVTAAGDTRRDGATTGSTGSAPAEGAAAPGPARQPGRPPAALPLVAAAPTATAPASLPSSRGGAPAAPDGALVGRAPTTASAGGPATLAARLASTAGDAMVRRSTAAHLGTVPVAPPAGTPRAGGFAADVAGGSATRPGAGAVRRAAATEGDGRPGAAAAERAPSDGVDLAATVAARAVSATGADRQPAPGGATPSGASGAAHGQAGSRQSTGAVAARPEGQPAGAPTGAASGTSTPAIAETSATGTGAGTSTTSGDHPGGSTLAWAQRRVAGTGGAADADGPTAAASFGRPIHPGGIAGWSAMGGLPTARRRLERRTGGSDPHLRPIAPGGGPAVRPPAGAGRNHDDGGDWPAAPQWGAGTPAGPGRRGGRGNGRIDRVTDRHGDASAHRIEGAAVRPGARPAPTGGPAGPDAHRHGDVVRPGGRHADGAAIAPGHHGAQRPASGPGSAAARFTDVLRRRSADAEQALPAHLQVLARALVGRPPVSMSTGPTSRAALAAAGKPAATIGRVIHLDHVPDRSARSAEIVAHELVHAASPSSVPRFFGDDHHDAEEHRAERTGTLVRALAGATDLPGLVGPPSAGGPPLLQRTFGAEGLAVTGPRAFGGNVSSRVTTAGADTTLRRSVGASSGGGSGPSAPTPLVPERAGRPAGGGWGTLLSRFYDEKAAAGDGGADHLAPGMPGHPLTHPSGAPVPTHTSHNQDSPPDLELTPELLDRIVEALEERVIEQLERRSFRHLPGVV